MEYLESLQATCPESAATIQEIVVFYNKSWWHEMTGKVFEVLPKLPEDARVKFFDNFLTQVYKKLNLLKVAELGIECSKTIKDAKAAREFLKKLGEMVKAEKAPENEQACTICKCEEASRLMGDGELKEAKKTLEECKEFVNKHDAQDLDPQVYARYYESWALYYELVNNHDQYYNTSLLFLVYSDLNTFPKARQQKLAFSIGKAALLGEKIYNFGELLLSPIVASLEGSEHQWIAQLLTAFNKGDINAFQKICADSAAKMQSVKALVEKADFLKSKVQLMSLLNLMFKIQNTKEANRVVTFEQVAQVTNSPLDEVEFLLLRALAAGVIKGTIDQVAATVTITWVQARVLDREEVGNIADKVKIWRDTVKEQLDLVLNTPGTHNEATTLSAPSLLPAF